MAVPHDVENYTIGKGILSIGLWVGAVPPVSFTDVGNASSIEIEHALERLPHYSSRAGLKVKDLNPVIQMDYTMTFTLDEIAVSNLKMFVAGIQDSLTLHALRVPDAEYALKFVSDNPIGPNRKFYFWRATLSPSGPMALIGDDWMQLNYTAEGLADTENHAVSPYYDIVTATTTTTSTTTTSTTSTTE